MKYNTSSETKWIFWRNATEHIFIQQLYPASSPFAHFMTSQRFFHFTIAFEYSAVSAFQRSTTKIILTNHCAPPYASAVE